MTIRSPLTAAFAVLLLASCRTEIEVPVGPPEVRNDYAKTAINAGVTLQPLANDFDPTGQTLDLVEIGQPANGVAVHNPDDSVTYTPNVGYAGGDSFAVWVRDTAGNRVRGNAYVSVGDSLRLYYRSNFEDYFTDQLYLADSNLPGIAIPVNRRMPITNGPYRPSTQVATYTPNYAGSDLMLYVADDRDDDSKLNVFLADLTALGTAQQLTAVPEGFGMILSAGSPVLTPDGQYMIYSTTELNLFDQVEVVRLEVANPANRVRLNPPFTDSDRVSKWTLSPDGTRVFYNFIVDADAVDQTVNGMYMVEVANPGVAVKISGTPTTGTPGPVALGGITFVPGTDLVLYTGTEGGANTIDLYMVDYVAQTAPVKLSGTALAGGVTVHALSPDGTRVLYLSTETDIDAVDLYTVTIANPGVSTQLSEVRTTTATVSSFGFGPDGSYALFIRDDDVVNQRELWRVDFANPTVRIKLNAPLATDEDVLNFRVSNGAPRQVLFATNPIPTNGRMQIKMVDVDSPGVITDIYEPVLFNGSDYAWSPDATSIILSGGHQKPLESAMFMLPLAAPTALIKLTPEDDPGDSVSSFTFVP